MAEFADHAALRVQAGHGGNGCASVHREKFKPLGGPDGGNGGRGGSVILEVDASASTLLDFHPRPGRKAANGHQGEGSQYSAAAGGRGGLGNAALASQRRKAPGFALKGEPGEERELSLELKTIADIGLVGLPDAGQPSLIPDRV